ncbi:conserved hypothetical protein [Aspergillus terreus NIH2624]|uniref:NAD-dependent epimerase/dehydratase domain-containing protein n=1 Tax=Aspergillus terreus (strain NIH 2624 / FGSC A1156) TaxID=341663 RepID=Q0CEX0_ASPTN|nr:uncharacterized protein ATEG_07764 [Aspergillus terreus NIH2624]EAU32026.1 conserved hypothetical protein [Aspergillus terreus NIH2624]
MTKIFLTGATGYIGGDVLSVLATKYPEFSISALIRSPEKAQQVQAQFPSVRIVHGGLDNSDLLEKESAAADIVLHTADASDHVGAAKAIAAGLAAGHSTDKPGYWLHTGGTGILTFADSDRGVFGDRDDKVYDDWDGVYELTHLPDHAFHRNVDQIVLDAGAKYAGVVKTALVCPPTIYGRGRGPCSQRSRQAYELARVTIQLQKAPIIGAGQSVWNNVHVHDLSDLFMLLVEAAVQGRADDGLWGANSYYLAENGEHCWGDLAREMAKRAAELGYIPQPVAEPINLDDAKRYAGFESLSWGMNSRGRARRARNLLGWKPSRPSLETEVPAILRDEWKRLQK